MQGSDHLGRAPDATRSVLSNAIFKQLKNATQRVAGLRERAATRPPIETLMWEAMQELDVAHEELRAAEDHVHAQADLLAAAQHALESEKRRYLNLFHGTPEAYLITDASGAIQDANRLAIDLLGCEPHFLPGKPLTTFVDLADRTLVRDRIDTILRAGQATSFELDLRGRGRRDPVRMSVSASRSVSAEDAPVTIHWLFRSARDPQPAASLLERWIEAERQARRRAELRSLEKNELVGSNAQTLRRSLSSIAGRLKVVGSSKVSAQDKQAAIASMTRNVRSAFRRLDELLAHVRAERDLAHLEDVPVELAPMLAHLIDNQRANARARGIRLLASIAVGGARLQGDSRILSHAFECFIENAIRFTAPGGEVLVISRRDTRAVAISIHHSGCGIAGHGLPTLLDAADPGREPDGLDSLQLSRRGIELHGGIVTGHAERDSGTLVVRLPLCEEKVATNPAQ